MFSTFESKGLVLAASLLFSDPSPQTNDRDHYSYDPTTASIPLESSASVQNQKAQPKRDDQPIVLEVDPNTGVPLGELVPPHGALLDPRDIPQILAPRFEVLRGLSGFDQSLTALFTRSIGFIVEDKALPKQYDPFIKSQRDTWNAELGEIGELALKGDPEQIIFAAMYHDTGRRPSPDRRSVTIVGAPELNFIPIETDTAQRIMTAQMLLTEFGVNTPKDVAKKLSEMIEPIKDQVDIGENPWFMHAQTQLTFIELGIWDPKHWEDTAFKISAKEFADRCREGLERELVTPLIPQLPADVTEGRVFFYEGLAAARVVPNNDTAQKKDPSLWNAPQELLDYNNTTHKPVLLLEVAAPSHASSKFISSQSQLSMIAGGREIELYHGPLPFK